MPVMLQKNIPETVDAYLQIFPTDTKIILQKIREIIKKAAPEAVEAMSYGMPGYKLNGKPLVYFGSWKSHVGFYATPSGNKAFAKELSKYKPAKGSIRFLLTEKIPYSLIKKIVVFRVKETNKIQKKK